MIRTTTYTEDRPAVRFRLPRPRWLALALAASVLFVAPGVLRYLEAARAAESHRYLVSIDEAQQQYFAVHGRYADDLTQLDLDRPEPTFFAVGDLLPGSTGSLETSWSLTLTRFGERPLFGAYTMTCENGELDWSRSTVDRELLNNNNVAMLLAGFSF